MEIYFFMSFLFGFGGLGILGIAITMHRSAQKSRKQATVYAEATIIQIIVDSHSKRNYIYEFYVNGIAKQVLFAGKRYRKEGDIISIFYDPKYPEMIYVPELQPCMAMFGLYFIGIIWIISSISSFIFWKLGIK